jgi:hypothetical protein
MRWQPATNGPTQQGTEPPNCNLEPVQQMDRDDPGTGMPNPESSRAPNTNGTGNGLLSEDPYGDSAASSFEDLSMGAALGVDPSQSSPLPLHKT